MFTALLALAVRAQLHLHQHRPDRGASLVEYALLVALIALVCIAAVSTFGKATASSFNSSSGAF